MPTIVYVLYLHMLKKCTFLSHLYLSERLDHELESLAVAVAVVGAVEGGRGHVCHVVVVWRGRRRLDLGREVRPLVPGEVLRR